MTHQHHEILVFCGNVYCSVENCQKRQFVDSMNIELYIMKE